MRTSTKATLAVACLLAVAALASADDNCRQPNGTACPINTEFKWTGGRGRTKTGSCVACSAGRYTPKSGSCCKNCDGIISPDPVSGSTTCTKCPEKSSIYPRPWSQRPQPASTCMCSAGYQATGISTVTGVTGCVKCPAGTFNAAPTSSPEACQPCATGSVAPKSGAKSCIACTSPSVASSDGKACMCPAGFYAKQGRSRSRSRAANGRRLQQVAVADSDDYKAPTCMACNSTTQNSQLNTWPVCCEASQTYDRTTKKCVTTTCYDGASVVNGACECPGGSTIAMYIDNTCSCFDSATWSNATSTCTCLTTDGSASGADYAATAGNAAACVCADGAIWTGSACSCEAANVAWAADQKKCVCPSLGLTWDASTGVCNGCPAESTWSTADGACMCTTAGTAWAAASNTCVPV